MRRMAAICAGLGAAALVAAAMPALGAGWVPSPDPTVIVDTANGKSEPVIASSTNGDAIAMWSEAIPGSQDGTTNLIAAVRHNGTWGAPSTLDTGPGNQSVLGAQVLIDANGFATAVWIRRYLSPDPNKLWFATRPAGGSWSVAAEVPGAGTNPEGLSVAITPNGAVTAAWRAGGGISAADKPAGSTTWTITQVANNGGAPVVAAGPSNQTAIVYAPINDLLKAKVRSGTGSWADVTAETASTDRFPDSPVSAASEPRAAFGPDGALHAAWHEYNQPVDGQEEIRTSSRSAAGSWTVNADAISSTHLSSRVQGIRGDADGNVTVVWTTFDLQPSTHSQYFAATRVSGSWEAEYPLTPEMEFGGVNPKLLINADGVFTAVWSRDHKVAANRRTAAGDWLETAENLSGLSVIFMAASNDSTGEPIAAWQRYYFSGAAHYLIETRTYDPEATTGDTGGPVTTLTKPNKPYYLAPLIPLEWQVVDPEGSPIDGTRAQVLAAPWNGSDEGGWQFISAFGPGTSLLYSASAGYTFCFQAQSQDNVTPNVGEMSNTLCTATPVDDRTPARSGTWKKSSDLKYYRGTILKSIDKGATLTLDGALAAQIALVVTKSPGAGKVSVKFAGQSLGTFSLNATKTKNKVVIPVADFGLVETGKLVVKVVSADGKKVQIDGILVSQM